MTGSPEDEYSRRRILGAAGVTTVCAGAGCVSDLPRNESTEPTRETVVQTTRLAPLTDPTYDDFYVCVRNDRESQHTVQLTLLQSSESVYEQEFALSEYEKTRRKEILSGPGTYQVTAELDGNKTKTVEWSVPESIESVTGVHVVVELQDAFNVGVADRQTC